LYGDDFGFAVLVILEAKKVSNESNDAVHPN